jgi:hypothetical protein
MMPAGITSRKSRPLDYDDEGAKGVEAGPGVALQSR